MKKKILFVTRQFGRVSGGLGVSAERIVKHLLSTYEVTVVEDDDSLRPLEAREIRKAPGFRHYRVNAGDEKSSHQFVSDFLLAQSREERPDLLAAFYGDSLAMTTVITAKWLGVPSAVFLRGNDVDLEIFDPKSRPLLWLSSAADRVFCVSREIESKVLALEPRARTAYVPNSVDSGLFLPGAASHGKRELFTLGLIGDLKAKKGLSLVLDALDFERHRLRVVGTLRPDQMKLLHGYTLVRTEARDGIEVTPFTRDANKLIEVYRSLDVVLIPSFHEGMPNVLLEAMSCGSIVVASRVAGMKDVIEHGVSGWLFDPWKDGALARAIELAGSMSEDERRQMSRAARATIERAFDLKHERRAYLHELGSLLERPQGSSHRSTLFDRNTETTSDADPVS